MTPPRQTLVLLNNALEEVDGLAAAAPSLTSLALSKNRLQTCPPAVVDLTRLVTLKLDYNPLLTIPRSVSRLSALTKLSLAHTQVRFVVPATRGQLCAVMVDRSFSWLALASRQPTE